MSSSAAAAADAALAAGDLPQALAIAEAAIAAGDRAPLLAHLIGWQRLEAGDLAGADALLADAAVRSPDDASLLTTLAQLRRRQGQVTAALALLDRALALAPDDAVAWLERGFALEAGSAHGEAELAYARAAAIDPGRGAAHAGLAWLAARRGDMDAARGAALRALAIDADDAVATCALARSETASGDAAAAIARLRLLLARTGLAGENRVLAAGLLGDALAAGGDTAAAFVAWGDAKAAFRDRHRAAAAEPGLRSYVDAIDAALAATPAPWQAPPPAAAPVAGHAFLLGFPRSGTTLVETILAGADGVETLEERPTLRRAEVAFFADSTGMARLARIDAATAGRLRDDYWAVVRGLGVPLAGRSFIDMDPLKGIRLPLIAQLFPEARIVMMRRDPRDVVLSCFRTNFVVSAAALAFADLAETARLYNAVMRLTMRAIETLPLNLHIVRYDEVVGDFDTTIARLCDFLGLAWTPGLRDFRDNRRARSVATASAGQVRRGLYDGTGQWRRFRRELAPVLPILAPWVAAFGFPPD